MHKKRTREAKGRPRKRMGYKKRGIICLELSQTRGRTGRVGVEGGVQRCCEGGRKRKKSRMNQPTASEIQNLLLFSFFLPSEFRPFSS